MMTRAVVVGVTIWQLAKAYYMCPLWDVNHADDRENGLDA